MRKEWQQHYEFMQRLIKQGSLLPNIKRIVKEILENFGLAKWIKEVKDDDLLSGDTAYSYYKSSKL